MPPQSRKFSELEQSSMVPDALPGIDSASMHAHPHTHTGIAVLPWSSV